MHYKQLGSLECCNGLRIHFEGGGGPVMYSWEAFTEAPVLDSIA